MKSTRHLRLRLRLIEGALLLLLGVLTAAAVSTHQLLLDAANHPTGNVDLADAHWTGTLDAARLPARVLLVDSHGNLIIGAVEVGATVHIDELGISSGGNTVADANGLLYAGGFQVTNDDGTLDAPDGSPIDDPDGFLRTGSQSYVGGPVTPTGYLLIRDEAGTTYRIPAVADGPSSPPTIAP